MTPEKLLTALNDIDSGAIREAHGEQRSTRRINRRFAAVLAAVLVLAAMTATAFAAEEIAGWFRHYFARQTQQELTPKQIEYIAENEHILAEVQENNGYCVELKSSMTSGETTYVTLGVTAPADVALEEMDLHPYEGMEVRNDRGHQPFSWGFQVQDDLDGLSNTVNIVLTIEPGDWKAEQAWYIQIDALYTTVYDEAYERELRETKYAGQTDIMFTSEETAKIYQYPMVAEGPWSFTVSLDGSDTQKLELLAEPVTVQAAVRRRGSDDITSDDYFIDTIEDVTITSFILTSLDASIYYDCDGTVRFAGAQEQRVYAVMKDGSRIELAMANGTSAGEDKLMAEAPIVLEEVEYVLLADGTELMVP